MLIIPGSGPTDRDGNNPLGVSAAPYRLLAEALAAQGVGSVRIDKRGMFGSAAAISDANAVTIADYAADVAVWVQAARERTGARCIWVIGHSEGGLVALSAAQRPEGVCGLITIAAPGRRLGAILREQLSAQLAGTPLMDQAEAGLTQLEAGERVDVSAYHPALQSLFAPAVQGFLIDLMAQDPTALASHLSVPLLIVQGDADLQVTVEDARALGAANPHASLALLAGVNHVLKSVPTGDRAANLASYTDANLPISSTVVATIAAFFDEIISGHSQNAQN